jgi:hypothetical protein
MFFRRYNVIDVTHEDLMTISEAAKLPFLRVNGKGPAAETIWRWMTRGSKGIRLESFQTPRGRCTTPEAVLRFLAALNGGKNPTPRKRQKEIERAERAAAAAGI